MQARRNLSWCHGDETLLAKLERGLPPPMPETFIHGDVYRENVLIDDDGTVSLIDWSDAGSGDARYDITLALQTGPELALTEAEVAAFQDAYGAAPLDPLTHRWFAGLYLFFCPATATPAAAAVTQPNAG